VCVFLFTCAVVVEDLREDGRVTVKEILVEDAVVVGLHLGEASQARGGNLSQRRPVDLMLPHNATQYESCPSGRPSVCFERYISCLTPPTLTHTRELPAVVIA